MNELSMNILDIARNSIKAEASLVEIYLEETSDELRVVIIDNGKGIENEMIDKVLDPFETSRQSRKVGLGLPLYKMMAELTGGYVLVSSNIGVGTTVNALFKKDSIDMLPLGNISETVFTMVCNENEADIVFKHQIEDKEIHIDTREIKEVLDDVSILEPNILLWIKENLEGQYE